MKNFLLSIFLISFCFQSKAQNDKEIKEKKNAFAISIGSPGLGLEYARKLSPKLNAKLVWHSFKLEDFEQEDLEIKDDKVDLLANVEISIIDMGIEYLPFKNSAFKLTAGFGILSKLNTNAVITYTEDVSVGNVIISKADVGEIDANISWSGVAPYLGLGFGRAIPKRRLGFGLEIGTYFASSPTVDLTASKLLAPTATQEDNLQESLESFKFIPRIQFRLAYKF
ncbi:hypothetical protein [Polaribacter sp. Z022]|uniref:hypothetical protein n=1 Tax=Polaribacter sp. Z022 TaxID=2927125 RepID=UPI0020211C4B|nr:hypothetical protein [Polaribacter sp. Z022]MCL7752894.1 hypothetical protein [Polaribacter sp. Z022]